MRKIILFAALIVCVPVASARFVSTDPVQPDTKTGENFNRYHYAAGNPYRYTDPDGREIRAANPADRVRIERERGELSRALDQLEAQGSD